MPEGYHARKNGDKYYSDQARKGNFSAANATCAAEGARLPTFKTQEDWVAITHIQRQCKQDHLWHPRSLHLQFAVGEELWLGVVKKRPEHRATGWLKGSVDKFVWVDGTPVENRHWMSMAVQVLAIAWIEFPQKRFC